MVQRLLLSLLAPVCEPAALLRLLELALWAPPPAERHLPRVAHPVRLLCRLLQRSDEALIALPLEEVASSIRELHLSSSLEAERLHAEALLLAARSPPLLLSALDTCTCAGSPPLPPYVCAYLDPSDLVPPASAGG